MKASAQSESEPPAACGADEEPTAPQLEPEPEPELSPSQHFGRAAIRESRPDDAAHEGGNERRSLSPATSVPLPELPTQNMQTDMDMDMDTDTDSDSDSGCPTTPRLPEEFDLGEPPVSVVLPAEQVGEIRALIEEAQADIAAGDYASGEAAIAHAEELESLAGKLRGRAPTIPTWNSSFHPSSGQLLPTEQVDEIRALIIEAESDIAAADYAGGEQAIAHAEHLEKLAGLLRGPPREAHDQWHDDVQKHVKSIHELHSERPTFGSSTMSSKERAVAKLRWQCSIEAHVEAIHALHVRKLLVKKRWRVAIESHVEAIKEVRSSRGMEADGSLVGHSSSSAGGGKDADTRLEAISMLWVMLTVMLVIMIVQAAMVNSQLTEIQEQLQCNASVPTSADAVTNG